MDNRLNNKILVLSHFSTSLLNLCHNLYQLICDSKYDINKHTSLKLTHYQHAHLCIIDNYTVHRCAY